MQVAFGRIRRKIALLRTRLLFIASITRGAMNCATTNQATFHRIDYARRNELRYYEPGYFSSHRLREAQ